MKHVDTNRCKQYLQGISKEKREPTRTFDSRVVGDTSTVRRPARWLWIVVTLAILSTTTGTGITAIEPCGKDIGMIQFDVINQWNLDMTRGGNVLVFARYWVCDAYYAISVIWTEPRGEGRDSKSLIVFSDETVFDMENEHHSFWKPINTRYPKPVGPRPPFRWGGGFYGSEERRFAEAQAQARRVYASDFESVKGRDGIVDVNVAEGPGGVKRNLTHLKPRLADGRIESMELFDDRRGSLAKMEYAYQRTDSGQRLTTLTAELPIRPEIIAGGTSTTIATDGQTTTSRIPDVNYVSHKGGRTCTVTYDDIGLGGDIVRLPIRIVVQRSDTKEFVRSARLMNFKRVDIEKAGVRQAARSFGGLGSAYGTWSRLWGKFLHHQPDLGTPSIDPNDFATVRRLIAKYPVWKDPVPPQFTNSKVKSHAEPPSLDLEKHRQQLEAQRRQREKENAERQKYYKQWQERVARMPRPPRKDVEPNDVRLIRQLYAHYKQVSLLTEEQKEAKARLEGTVDAISHSIAKSQGEIRDIREDLYKILKYHRIPQLPEDRPPEPNDSDLKLIRELSEHYEELAVSEDRGLGGQLKALFALTRLDLVADDYGAFKDHVCRYLQMLVETDLDAMYLTGGFRYVEDLVEAGQYRKAKELMQFWVGRAASVTNPDEVYRWCGATCGGRMDPWIAVELLDRFLERSDLSAIQRYEALALRAISLDKIDKLLADPKADEDPDRATQKRWILRNARSSEIDKMVTEAIVKAVSAWEALGPVRYAEARPYSTENMSGMAKNIKEAPDATRLQETSAQLDQIVRRRISQSAGQQQPGSPRRVRR